MLMYVLIGLCLTLAGVAGLQMTYMVYLDRMDRERKKRLHQLELKCTRLLARLEESEEKILVQESIIDSLNAQMIDEETWADVIDDR
jgi:hypothetical protein